MTSDDTDAKTKALLENNSYFGMDKEQVTFVKQEKASAAERRPRLDLVHRNKETQP